MNVIKQRFDIDDSLDVFAVHGVGGMLGTLLAAIFALPVLGGAGLPEGADLSSQIGVQAIGVIAVVLWTAIASLIILKITNSITALRASEDEITEGMDLAYHGEQDYNY